MYLFFYVMITNQETILLAYIYFFRDTSVNALQPRRVLRSMVRDALNKHRIRKNKNLCNSVHRVNKNKTDYCIKIMLQQLVASNFAIDREKF